MQRLIRNFTTGNETRPMLIPKEFAPDTDLSGIVSHTPWSARLELGFARQDARTVPVHRWHSGPLRVQKALWPEDNGACHMIIVHPPAGIAGGDELVTRVELAENSHALLTTPGAGKWYGSDGRMARQQVQLNVGPNALLEWLPQEVILFNGARVDSATCIQLHDTASFIGWELLETGRQSRGERFEQGQYASTVDIRRDSQLLLHDCMQFNGGDRWLQSPLGMHGHAVTGSLWAMAPAGQRSPAQLDETVVLLRELIARMKMPLQVTRLDELLVARYLGSSAREGMDGFAGLRARLRQLWFNFDEAFPRIWKT